MQNMTWCHLIVGMNNNFILDVTKLLIKHFYVKRLALSSQVKQR